MERSKRRKGGGGVGVGKERGMHDHVFVLTLLSLIGTVVLLGITGVFMTIINSFGLL